MATVTRVVGTTTDTGGAVVRLEYDYDDAFSPPRLTAVRVVNAAARGGVAEVARQADGRVFSLPFPAAQTSALAVNTGGAQRFDVTIGRNGRLEGVELVRFMLT